MKIIKDFISFTNLKNNRIKLTAMLIVPSLLYCMMMSFVNTIIYMGNPYYYYLALYIFVLWAAYIYMILLFQFVQKKRDVKEKLKLKAYILPLIGVQSIYFILMIGTGFLTFTTAGNVDSTFYYILTPLCILFTILYVPLQVLSFFAIYDGMRNPLKIIGSAFMKLMIHYRSCFYALLTLVLVALFYQIIMGVCFNINTTFTAFSAVQDIMISSNPFMNAVDYMIFAFQNSSLWPAVIVSFIYGILMCMSLVYYYMAMLCVHDEDIKV